jgi:mannose-1-phosphate guanylyltransferase
MRALLLAAGEGTRLQPLTADRPKPMLPIGGAPLLEHLIRLLRHHGIQEIAINLHYTPDAIVAHFGDGHQFGVHITYSPEAKLLGSAGAARQLDWFLNDTFLVLYGDVLTNLNLTALIDHHYAHAATGTIAVHEVDEPTRCGVVKLAHDDRVVEFVEKPSSAFLGTLANAGLYVLEPSVLRAVPAGQPFDFGRDLFPLLLGQGIPLYGYRATSYVLDVGSPERYAQAEADWRDGRFRLDAAPVGGPWYVVRSKPRAERLAAMAIEARGLIAYLPEWSRRRRGGQLEREPLFPGYLFVRTDGRKDALLRARSAPNVAHLLGGAAGPEPVPDELVQEIRVRCEQRAREPFVKGQRVKIKQGPFRELDAVFDAECSSGTRARVFVQLLNRLVPVILDTYALRRAI